MAVLQGFPGARKEKLAPPRYPCYFFGQEGMTKMGFTPARPKIFGAARAGKNDGWKIALAEARAYGPSPLLQMMKIGAGEPVEIGTVNRDGEVVYETVFPDLPQRMQALSTCLKYMQPALSAASIELTTIEDDTKKTHIELEAQAIEIMRKLPQDGLRQLISVDDGAGD